jgi:DNA-binding NarL/FixJ family response regulator
VEDEILLAMNLELSLKEMGYSVVGCVITGEEALSLIENDKPDIVVIDITLDGEIDGIETSKRIMHMHNIPSVIMTGSTDHDTLRRVNELNPVAIIYKPVTDRKLSSVLQKAFL